MDDSDVHAHIEELVAEEHRLTAAEAEGSGPTDEQRSRLQAIRVELDRYWDLLRQRRAREEFGQDPDSVSMRDAGTVEGYEQ